MLSGMNPKVQNRNQKAIDEWLAEGNEITVIPSKFETRTAARTKSHQMGGRWSSYNVGGNAKTAAKRRSA